MKRIIRSFLCGATAAFMLFASACSAAKETPPTEDLKSPEDYNVLIEGYDFKLLDEAQDTDQHFGALTDNAIHDDIMKRIADMQTKYGFNFEYEYIAAATDGGALISQLTTGNNIGEVLRLEYNNHAGTFCRAGLLMPISELSEYIDYTNFDKFGRPSLLECALYESEPYAVTNASWPYQMGWASFLIMFNRDLITELNLTDPHEFYENKSWTFETFGNIISDWYQGKDATPKYVMVGAKRGFVQLALLNNGIRFVTENDGEISTDIYSQASHNALDWLNELYSNNTNLGLYNPSNYWDTQIFRDGDTIMSFVSSSNAISGVVQYDSDIPLGFMPFPSGPDATYGEFATYIETIDGYTFPITADYPEGAAFIINELFEPLEGYGDENGMASYYRNSVFFDDIDTEIYMHHLDYARYSYWNFNGLALSMSIADGLGNKTTTEMLEKYGPSYEKVIDEQIKGNAEFLSKYIYNNK